MNRENHQRRSTQRWLTTNHQKTSIKEHGHKARDIEDTLASRRPTTSTSLSSKVEPTKLGQLYAAPQNAPGTVLALRPNPIRKDMQHKGQLYAAPPPNERGTVLRTAPRSNHKGIQVSMRQGWHVVTQVRRSPKSFAPSNCMKPNQATYWTHLSDQNQTEHRNGPPNAEHYCQFRNNVGNSYKQCSGK